MIEATVSSIGVAVKASLGGRWYETSSSTQSALSLAGGWGLGAPPASAARKLIKILRLGRSRNLIDLIGFATPLALSACKNRSFVRHGVLKMERHSEKRRECPVNWKKRQS